MAFAGVYSANKKDDGFENSRNGILLRRIGHNLLRSSGDDTSRVMPIQQFSPTWFRIRFEHQLSILPDSIIGIVNTSLSTGTLPGDYTVNVVDCDAKEIVYGFTVATAASNNAMPCKGRPLPTGCYYIDLRFSQAGAINQQKSIGYIIAAIAGGILIGAFAWNKKRKKNTILPEEVVAGNNGRIKIGQYDFYFEQHCIEWQNVKTTLTNKESKLLYIFAASINEVIDRNTLQQEVWGNEGVIVTRSLDMFVSKLRKKLQADPSVKIVNFPGKGYKLEVTV